MPASCARCPRRSRAPTTRSAGVGRPKPQLVSLWHPNPAGPAQRAAIVRICNQVPSCVRRLEVSCQERRTDTGRCSSMPVGVLEADGACACFRRAMGDIVEEMDSHRRKSFALLTRKGAEGRAEATYSEQPPLSRASRSFSKVGALLQFPYDNEKRIPVRCQHSHVHDVLHRRRKRPLPRDKESLQAASCALRIESFTCHLMDGGLSYLTSTK